ncbi:hypothetical protein YC2023_009709 [Brassica napus]
MGSPFRMKSAHHADIKGMGILYEDDDAPIKLVDRDDSFAIKELGLTLIGKSSLMKREMYSRNSHEYEIRPDLRNRLRESNNNYSRSWGKDRSDRSHADRIIRRKDESMRSDRYAGGRARTGPYDRNEGRSWRVKPKIINITDSEPNGSGAADKKNDIVPYEQFLGAGPQEPLNFGNDLSSSEEKKENTPGTRKLASAIVTPSRLKSIENVTVRSRVLMNKSWINKPHLS